MFSYGRPTTILFDLDGTLVDTMHLFADLAAELMVRDFGLEFDTARARYLETSGVPFIHQLAIIVPAEIQTHRATSDEFEQRKRDICTSARLEAETRAALEQLRASELKLVVSSNTGQPFVDEFVEREGFPFDMALGFDPDLGMQKGEPHVVRACESLGVTRDQIWFVGDSLADGQLASGCDLAFIGRTGTFQRAAFLRTFPRGRVIDRISELLQWI